MTEQFDAEKWLREEARMLGHGTFQMCADELAAAKERIAVSVIEIDMKIAALEAEQTVSKKLYEAVEQALDDMEWAGISASPKIREAIAEYERKEK